MSGGGLIGDNPLLEHLRNAIPRFKSIMHQCSKIASMRSFRTKTSLCLRRSHCDLSLVPRFENKIEMRSKKKISVAPTTRTDASQLVSQQESVFCTSPSAAIFSHRPKYVTKLAGVGKTAHDRSCQ